MKANLSSFIVKFSIYTAIILVISIVIHFWVSKIGISPAWPFILLFLYSFTIFASVMLMKYIDSRISQFANAFMLVNFGKLIIFTAIIVVYALLVREDAIAFTITFFVYYLLMTTYEIIALLKMQKSQL